jgi:hypothetical protein
MNRVVYNDNSFNDGSTPVSEIWKDTKVLHFLFSRLYFTWERIKRFKLTGHALTVHFFPRVGERLTCVERSI